ncbi:hypothetical protein [Mycoplasma sp. 31_09]|uniref:hypothetical protein n=1 Tax=Mycoplasma sp. 31_09 TaxID=3401663 RepID=UPI003AAD4E8B
MRRNKNLNKIILVGIAPITIVPIIIASKCNSSQNNDDKTDKTDKTDKINDNKIKEQVQNLKQFVKSRAVEF